MPTSTDDLQKWGRSVLKAYAATFARNNEDVPPLLAFFVDGEEVCVVIVRDGSKVTEMFEDIPAFGMKVGVTLVEMLQADAVSFTVNAYMKMQDEPLMDEYSPGDFEREFAEDPASDISEAVVVSATTAEGGEIVMIAPWTLEDGGQRLVGDVKEVTAGGEGRIIDYMRHFWDLEAWGNGSGLPAPTIDDFEDMVRVFESVGLFTKYNTEYLESLR